VVQCAITYTYHRAFVICRKLIDWKYWSLLKFDIFVVPQKRMPYVIAHIAGRINCLCMRILFSSDIYIYIWPEKMPELVEFKVKRFYFHFNVSRPGSHEMNSRWWDLTKYFFVLEKLDSDYKEKCWLLYLIIFLIYYKSFSV